MPVTTEVAALSLIGAGADKLDATVKTQAYQAAEQYVADRCRWPGKDDPGSPVAAPSALVQAVSLLTARYLERRNSASGVLGAGDFGVIRVSGSDRDVDALIAPYRKRVFG